MLVLTGFLTAANPQKTAMAEVSLSDPYAVTIDGRDLISLGINTQALLQVDIDNQNSDPQECIILVEIRDSGGVTIYLQFQKGVLAAKTNSQIGISWTPSEMGDYQVRSFVLSSFENPVILSTVSVSVVTVTANAQVANYEEPAIEKTTYPEKEPTLYGLRKYALDRINEDRAKFGLPEVQLSNNIAAQVHAEDVLKSRTISHWMSNGEKPYMTYTRYAGLGSVAQNVATTGDSYSYLDCTSGQYSCDEIDPFHEIDTHEHGLVYDDEDCCDNGHRDNILDKYHTDVSIGIAYDAYFFVMVQNFENNYIDFDKPISKDNRHIIISDDLLNSDEVYGIYVYYDETPTEEIYEQHKDDRFYTTGQLIAGVTNPGYKYDDILTIATDKWSVSGTSIDIEFNVEPAISGSGVYTIEVVLEDSHHEPYSVTNYSVFESG